METYLETALGAARAASEIALAYYRGDFRVELKEDQTPVTVADRECESVIRRTLLEAFPDHGFYGEESGRRQADAEHLWLVDPIDGTKSFVGGYGMWSTQIALMHRGELVLGVSAAPAAGETAWAARGLGARLNGESVRVSETTDLARAAVSTGNIGSLARSDRWASLGRIMARANRAVYIRDKSPLLSLISIERRLEIGVQIIDLRIAEVSQVVGLAARAEPGTLGFDEIADWFETLAKAERSHANRFQKALDTLDG